MRFFKIDCIASEHVNVPAGSATGSHTVSWNGVAMAVNYRLESVNGGGWGLIQDDGSTGRSFGGVPLGTYAYRVQACNAVGSSGYSKAGSIYVNPPPLTIRSPSKFQWMQGTLTKIRCDHQ